MDSGEYKAEALEKTMAIGILLKLQEIGDPVISGNLAGLLSRRSAGTSIDRVNDLEKAGLVVSVREDKKPFRKYISLTPRGLKVAKHLRAIEEILSE